LHHFQNPNISAGGGGLFLSTARRWFSVYKLTILFSKGIINQAVFGCQIAPFLSADAEPIPHSTKIPATKKAMSPKPIALFCERVCRNKFNLSSLGDCHGSHKKPGLAMTKYESQSFIGKPGHSKLTLIGCYEQPFIIPFPFLFTVIARLASIGKPRQSL
jgi:hypothetical protein